MSITRLIKPFTRDRACTSILAGKIENVRILEEVQGSGNIKSTSPWLRFFLMFSLLFWAPSTSRLGVAIAGGCSMCKLGLIDSSMLHVVGNFRIID